LVRLEDALTNECLVVAPSAAKPGATDALRVGLGRWRGIDWETGHVVTPTPGRRVSVWYRGPEAGPDAPKCLAEKVVVEPEDFATRLRKRAQDK
jgi:hypothetical protein